MHARTLVPLAAAATLACSDRPTAPTGTALSPPAASADRSEHSAPTAHRLVTGLQRARGSTVGPDGALYVTEAAVGRISRVNPETGTFRTFASGLPISTFGPGGVVDVAFLGRTAYALVTLVSPDVGGHNADGIYRVDGPHTFTLIADLGAFSMAHPPSTAFAIASGVQYALERFHGGFLVTDGHHNRVLRVSGDGEISVLRAFDNIVPTGMTVSGPTVYMAEAGPVPHPPENGKVVAFTPRSRTVRAVASGARLAVDVEFGRGHTLFALSQGEWNGVAPGSPAKPNTGSLMRANRDGTFSVIVGGLDRPTSLKFIGNTAYVATLGGEIWTIDVFGNEDDGHEQR